MRKYDLVNLILTRRPESNINIKKFTCLHEMIIGQEEIELVNRPTLIKTTMNRKMWTAVIT